MKDPAESPCFPTTKRWLEDRWESKRQKQQQEEERRQERQEQQQEQHQRRQQQRQQRRSRWVVAVGLPAASSSNKKGRCRCTRREDERKNGRLTLRPFASFEHRKLCSCGADRWVCQWTVAAHEHLHERNVLREGGWWRSNSRRESDNEVGQMRGCRLVVCRSSDS